MQRNLWEDGFSVLWEAKTGEIGKTRLKRYLVWLDKLGCDWTEPDLDAYAEHLRSERRLNEGTIYHTLAELRNHYLAVLSNETYYEHIQPKRRSRFVNHILEHLGYNTATINYRSLTNDNDSIGSPNYQVILPPNASMMRNSTLKKFIYWLDETGRHWTQPDLLLYKLVLQEEDNESPDFVKNALNGIRKRYFELVEDEDLMATLDEDTREAFVRDLRKRLGYLDEFPPRQFATRDMVENDPYNKTWLDQRQVKELLSQPDVTTMTGIRDRALLGLAIAVGLQPSDVHKIMVEDLFADYEGQPAFYFRPAKSREARCVPYEDYGHVQDWLRDWLKVGEIESGAVFRGTYGNRDVLRPKGIAPETAADIVARYPVTINNSKVSLFFSDLRSTAGRRWYDKGIPLEEIERRLSLNYRRSTLSLIGLRLKPEFAT